MSFSGRVPAAWHMADLKLLGVAGVQLRETGITLGKGCGPDNIPAQTHGWCASSQALGFTSVISVVTLCPRYRTAS